MAKGSIKNTFTRSRLRFDNEAFLNEITLADWTAVTICQDVNEAVTRFSTIIDSAITNNSKQVNVRRSHYNLKPWITPGLIKCQKHRDRLHLKAKQHPENIIIQISYKRYRNFLNNILRKTKSDYENKTLAAHKNNPKKLWNTIKDICHLNKAHKNPTDLLKTSPDPISSLNHCNTFFTNAGKNLADKTLKELSTTQELLATSVKLKNSMSNSFFMNPTDENEVDSLICDLKLDSSPGIDKCSPHLIKLIKKIIIKPLTHIYNLSLATGIFPEAWKTAIITPIHKSGDKKSPTNYRPISLLIIFSKLLEKLVNKRLVVFLESNDLIPDRQFGFRHGRSTEDAVMLLTNTVSNALDQNQSCLGVFLDLAKAFDTVSTPILLQKLNLVGIRGVALDWFSSYLLNRKQCVRVGTVISDQLQVEYGVPQGSVLGPTLFLIYMCDLLELAMDGSNTLCYADDTVILFQGSSWDDVYTKAEQGLAHVADWLKHNLLTLNAKKTKYIAFHKTARSQPEPSKTLKLHHCMASPQNYFGCNCQTVDRTDSIKYLGVTVDENLSFEIHVSNVAARIRKNIYVMKNLINSATKETLLLVYKALSQSLLMYCIRVWGGAAKSFMIVLERAQRAVLKVMLQKPFTFSTNQLYMEAKVLRVRQLFIVKAATSVHSTVLKSPEYDQLVKRRVFKIAAPSVNTAFAKRHPSYLLPHIYNRICHKLKIKTLPTRSAKQKIEYWLSSLDYTDTETILT